MLPTFLQFCKHDQEAETQSHFLSFSLPSFVSFNTTTYQLQSSWQILKEGEGEDYFVINQSVFPSSMSSKIGGFF